MTSQLGRREAAEGQATPSAWVDRWLDAVTAGGRVLDVACGKGRHVGLAISRGYHVVGIDRDVGAHPFAGMPDFSLVAADLETAGGWPLGPGRFDGVIVTNYLHRPILADIVAAVADDGVLIYETFAAGQAAFGRPRRAAFLLEPDELLAAVHGRLSVVAYEHGLLGAPERLVQRIAAVGPRHRWRLDPAAQPLL